MSGCEFSRGTDRPTVETAPAMTRPLGHHHRMRYTGSGSRFAPLWSLCSGDLRLLPSIPRLSSDWEGRGPALLNR